MKTLVLATGALLALAVPDPRPGDWPVWRGPGFTGTAPAGNYPVKWTADTAAWKVPLPGKGTSTPIVWRDRIYLTTPAEGQDAVLAVDRGGRQAWLARLGPESPPRHRSLASSCNASPATDGTAVFARFRSGRLAALEMDGRVRWQVNLDERFGPEQIFWDAASSPVLTQDCVVVARMHHGESWLAGFDKQTGAQRWLQKRNYETPTENDNSYTTPVLFQHGGRPAILVWGADHLTAHSASDGSLLWQCGGFNPAGTGFWPAIATPVVVDGMAIVPVGRDDRPRQARIHGIRLGGSGDVTATHRAWQRDDLGVFCASPAVYKGRVYLLRHRGGIVCLDPANGKTIWEEALPRASASYYASPVIAGGVLYAAREDGVVFAVRVENGFELLGENPVGEQLIATPVPTSGSLLIRGERHLYCIRGAKS